MTPKAFVCLAVVYRTEGVLPGLAASAVELANYESSSGGFRTGRFAAQAVPVRLLLSSEPHDTISSSNQACRNAEMYTFI